MFERAFETPFGRVLLRADGAGITELRFHTDLERDDAQPVLLLAEEQLREYFAGRRKDFSVPLSMHGTDFQIRVWNALRSIPYGEVRTYAQIAREVGSPRAFRAVGMANHVNRLAVFVPCHRVIGSDGKLTGYAAGTDLKRELLELEGYNVEA